MLWFHRTFNHTRPSGDIFLSEWRLVGPGLAALIICLAYRMRLSRVLTQAFLHDWLGLEISVGTLQATLHESGAAALPVEDELVEAIQASGLLNVDETSWPELGKLLWLWVFCGQGVVAYWIAYRDGELLANVLGTDFKGWLELWLAGLPPLSSAPPLLGSPDSQGGGAKRQSGRNGEGVW